jgi:SAM-dependent methyltransferase
MTTYEKCPVCQGTDIREVMRVIDHTVSGKTFPIYHCNQCTARFTQQIPGETEIGEYYLSEDYISHSDSRKGLINQLYHGVRSITLKHKRKMIGKAVAGKKGNILDYGCGTGAFLYEMKKAGWQTSGLEPSLAARELARDLNDSNIFPPEYIHSFPDNHFDVITLWHVLEHVHRLHQTLKQLNRVLKPGGVIFIAVPNYTSADAENYGTHWAAWDVPRHLYHFSPSSIKQLLPAHGFRLKAIRPMWFDSFYVSMLSEKYRTGDGNLVSAFYNGLKSNILASGNIEKCSSVIYVAEKS